MRRVLSWATAVVIACGISACGEKGGGGTSPVGAWTMDADATMGPMLDAALAKAREGMQDLSPDQRAAAENVLPSTDEMKKSLREQLATMSVAVELKPNGTATYEAEHSGEKETGTGTWEAKEGKVVVVRKTKNGLPVVGDDAKPVTFEMKDGGLAFRPSADGPELRLKRR